MYPSVPWSCLHSKVAMPAHNLEVIWMTKPPVFFLLTISNKSTPKLKTSDFNENLPSITYFGDI
ncbi:unnamed protein product, partial [Vitis vinifera]|uniref:Uncharacterized protein n=1 Tax=Vitis vinifera TaxID=29760 RepID=D7SRX1_VITVI